MQMFQQTLTDSAWVEVLNGGSAVAFDVVDDQSRALIHHNESGTAPALGAIAADVKGNTNDWDYAITDLVAGTDRLWVRSQNGDVEIVGVR